MRLVLPSKLFAPEAKLAVCSSEVQGDCGPKLHKLLMGNKLANWEAEADDVCFLFQKASGARQAVQAQKLTAFAKLLEAPSASQN